MVGSLHQHGGKHAGLRGQSDQEREDEISQPLPAGSLRDCSLEQELHQHPGTLPVRCRGHTDTSDQ